MAPTKDFDPAEIAVISFFGLLLVIQIVVTIYVLIRRNYPPFKAKQVDLIVVSVISECFWFVGQLQALKFLPESGAFAICSIWVLWFNLVLGLFMWGGVLELRFAKLFLIFKMKKKWPNWKMNLMFFIFWTPSTVFAIVGTIMSDTIFSHVEEYDQVCYLNNNFLYALYGYAAVYVMTFVFFMIALRNLKHSAFNEYIENLRSTVTLIICYIVFTILTGMDLNIQHVWARCVSFGFLQILHNVAFWNILGYVVFMSLKDDAGFEKSFKDQMARDSMDIVRSKTKTVEPEMKANLMENEV